MRPGLAAAVLLGLGLFAAVACAQEVAPDPALGETVQMVPKAVGPFTLELETTVFKPPGPGPFPLALINHGKAAGNPRFQARYRPTHAVRFFLRRGYAVLVPMRQGFSRSGGGYVGGGCNVESNGRVQAEDVQAVLDWAVAQPWVDRERIVVLGQSHGGWTTLAFGAQNYRGVRGLVNFAGGLRQDCPNWKDALATAAGGYGGATRVPSLWFYGDNDSYFDPDTFRSMFSQYQAAGGAARLVAFGPFGSDAHAMFGARAGTPIWQPEVDRFLAAIGLPAQADARGAVDDAMAPPPPTGFAALDDVDRLPFVRDSGRAGYRVYLGRPLPRAFALAPNGAWGRADGGDDPLQRALAFCNRNGGGRWKLYSVDNHVVWNDTP